MGFAALVAFVAPFSLAAWMVFPTGLQLEQPWWIVLNGAIVLPVSFFCLGTGPKYISGPEVAMFYLLETVLAPIWVWMIFAEAPSRYSLIGGGILIVTLLVHSLWLLLNNRHQPVGPSVQSTAHSVGHVGRTSPANPCTVCSRAVIDIDCWLRVLLVDWPAARAGAVDSAENLTLVILRERPLTTPPSRMLELFGGLRRH